MLLLVLLGIIAVPTGLVSLGENSWPGDMIAFFRPYLALLSVFLVVFAVGLRTPVPLVTAAVVLMLNAYPLFVAAVPAAESVSAANIRIVSANVLFDNQSKGLFRDIIGALAPDVIVTQEAKFEWPADLRTLPGYPCIVGPDISRWNGNIVVSRFPLRARLVEDMPRSGKEIGGGQAIRVEVDRPAAKRPLIVYAIHAPTPRTKAGWEARNQYLATLAVRVAAEPPGTDVVVVGDWNTPVWSPAYISFFAASGLIATEHSAWPSPTRIFADFGGPVVLGTPIDHVAVSPGIGVKRLFVGPYFGSDHRPVTADLYIP